MPPPSPPSTRLAPPPARQQGAARLPPRELPTPPSTSPGLAAIGPPDWQPSSEGDAAVELGRCIADAPDAPPELADTLGKMVGQIDVLAQTMALLEQRLTLSEEKGKVSETLLRQILESQQILEAGFLERVADKKASLSARAH